MSSYHVTVTDDGNGNFTGVLRRGGTAASGGTTIAGSQDQTMATSTKAMEAIFIRALQVAKNDRAAGN